MFRLFILDVRTNAADIPGLGWINCTLAICCNFDSNQGKLGYFCLGHPYARSEVRTSFWSTVLDVGVPPFLYPARYPFYDICPINWMTRMPDAMLANTRSPLQDFQLLGDNSIQSVILSSTTFSCPTVLLRNICAVEFFAKLAYIR